LQLLKEKEMIIYRLTGRATLFPKCGGMNSIVPRVSANLTAFRKEVAKYRKEMEKDKVAYKVTLQKLVLRPPTKDDIMQMFGEYEDPWHVVVTGEVLNVWEYTP
jgi:hypothetical protein